MKKLSQEEAAKVLEGMKVKIEIPKAAVTQCKRNTALDMAIEALKCSGVPNNSDCISRQNAIELIERMKPYHQDADDIAEMIANMPSAQPGWIPWNSGRFPEESGTYTVTAYDGATKRVTYAKYQKRLKRWELTGARAYWRVLAWMPRPEPYKEEEGEL